MDPDLFDIDYWSIFIKAETVQLGYAGWMAV